MSLTIEPGPDSITVTLTVPREALAGMTKTQAVQYLRDELLDRLGWERILNELGWGRLVDLLPLIAQPRSGRIANVGEFISAVLRRDKPAAVSALTAMVTDGTLLASEAQAIAGAFVE